MHARRRNTIEKQGKTRRLPVPRETTSNPFPTRQWCAGCRGHGTDVTVTCPNCVGTGYDPHEDNPFAQCHQCYGEGETTLEVCPDCGGSGEAQDPEDE